jgi:hypothetical protein
MKKKITFWVSGLMAMILLSNIAIAQKFDEERMTRDIEVAENVLATLIKQELNHHRMFGLDIKGAYQPGYGVTFRLPGDYMAPMVFTIQRDGMEDNVPVIYSTDGAYTISTREREAEEAEGKNKEKEKDYKLKEKSRQMKKVSADSVRDAYNLSVIKAAKDFVLDYGDFISQLGPNEKIIVTNRGTQDHWAQFGNQKRSHLSVEAVKSDISAFRQGKISRDQALAKVKVVNTESVNEKLPDIEMLSSIFNRLYRADLSKTYFTENMVYYEVLKDYGVIYYMNVYSSNERDYKRYSMPTLGLDDVDKETRDKKVIELYPKFEKELKENILEYGRTLKSLKDEEVLIFNVTLTKCKGCNIPESIEVSIKASALKDYGTGKIDQGAALSKFTVKKGANQ